MWGYSGRQKPASPEIPASKERQRSHRLVCRTLSKPLLQGDSKELITQNHTKKLPGE
ncbi:MAG: hypothetical protein PT119_12360 [Aphanizomenon gracile PMC627.10]|nr:hypothetical protein [Aphanizomenon gracile PMC627.10]